MGTRNVQPSPLCSSVKAMDCDCSTSAHSRAWRRSYSGPIKATCGSGSAARAPWWASDSGRTVVAMIWLSCGGDGSLVAATWCTTRCSGAGCGVWWCCGTGVRAPSCCKAAPSCGNGIGLGSCGNGIGLWSRGKGTDFESSCDSSVSSCRIANEEGSPSSCLELATIVTTPTLG